MLINYIILKVGFELRWLAASRAKAVYRAFDFALCAAFSMADTIATHFKISLDTFGFTNRKILFLRD